MRLDAIAPGRVWVGLEGAIEAHHDQRWHSVHGTLLDLKEVAVTSGQTTQVQLRAAANRLSRAPVSGRVMLPDAWNGIIEIKMGFVPRQGQAGETFVCVAPPRTAKHRGTEEDPSGYRVLEFDAGRLPSGRYDLRIKHPHSEFSIFVPLGGRDDLEVEIEHPITLSVQLVDNQTGQSTPHLSLDVVPVEGVFPAASRDPEAPRKITRSSPNNDFVFQATSGYITLKAPATATYGPIDSWITPQQAMRYSIGVPRLRGSRRTGAGAR